MRIYLLIFFIVNFNISGFANSGASGQMENDKKKLEKNAEQYQKRLKKCNKKYLESLAKEENKLKRKLDKINPDKSKALFSKSSNTFQKLKSENEKLENSKLASSKVKYLEGNPDSNKLNKTDTISLVNLLEENLKDQATVSKYINERRKILNENLKNDKCSAKLKSINKTSFYYKQQLTEYKNGYNKKDKIEKELERFVLKKSKINQINSRENDQNTNLNNWPNENLNLNKLKETQELLKRNIAKIDSLKKENVKNKILDSKEKIKQIKLLNNTGFTISSTEDIPDFKPNIYKTKRFIDRISFAYDLDISNNIYYSKPIVKLALKLVYTISENDDISVGVVPNLTIGEKNKPFFDYHGFDVRASANKRIYKIIYSTVTVDRLASLTNKRIVENDVHNNSLFNAKDYSINAGLKIKYSLAKILTGTFSVLYDFMNNANDESRIRIRYGIDF